MKFPGSDAHLTYCLNIHRGESWGEAVEAIGSFPVRVRTRLGATGPFALGLRLSARAAEESRASGALEAVRAVLDANGLYVVTVNGFPYGEFHGRPVKANVYRPDWRAPERLAYTCRLAEVMAALLPEGVEGSISTVPVSYGAWIASPAESLEAAANLGAFALYARRLAGRTGRSLVLALEPEPDCSVQTTAGLLEFFRERLLDPVVLDRVARREGEGRRIVEEAIRRHVGACLDACHLAVQFEDPQAALESCAREGVRVAKVQLSAALEAFDTPAALRALPRFADPVYLHQTRVRGTDGRIASFPDLGPALESAAAGAVEGTWRTHVHVPLYFAGGEGVRSTSDGITSAFLRESARAAGQLEIETYTFDVLPGMAKDADVVESLAREYRWVLGRW